MEILGGGTTVTRRGKMPLRKWRGRVVGQRK